MKADRLEDIYREKFTGLSIEPSDRAKILFDEKMIYRNRKLLYRRLAVAASLLLITISGALLIPSGRNGIEISDRSNIVEGKILSGEILDERESISIENAQIAEKKEIQPEKDEITSDNGMKNSISIKPDSDKIELADQPAERMDLEPVKEGIVLNGNNQLSEEKEALHLNPDPIDHVESDPEKESFTEEMSEVKQPVKITIEYIAGNSGNPARKGGKEIMQKFYSNINNLLYPDEVLGDIRSLKDQLFALDFENENKSETQNNKKK